MSVDRAVTLKTQEVALIDHGNSCQIDTMGDLQTAV